MKKSYGCTPKEYRDGNTFEILQKKFNNHHDSLSPTLKSRTEISQFCLENIVFNF